MDPPLDWNDLRYFVEVGRLGTLTAAARQLRVDPGTISRRIAAMEAALHTACFERRTDGFFLTAQGQALLGHAERVEEEVAALERAARTAEGEMAGSVSISVAEGLASAFMIPTIAALSVEHPNIHVELLTQNSVANLERREVDVALRLVRPQSGDLLARKIGLLEYGLFASSAYLTEHPAPVDVEALADHRLIDWCGDYPKAAPAEWFRRLVPPGGAFLKVNGTAERIAAVEQGVGIIPLPFITARQTTLVRVLPEVEVPPMEIWLVVHRTTARVPRVRLIMDFIVKRARESARLFSATD